MKIALISDTHTFQQELEDLWKEKGAWDDFLSCDMVAHSGDATLRGNYREAEEFLDWFSKLPIPELVLVPGNHDFCFDPAYKSYTTKGEDRHGFKRKYGERFEELRNRYPNVKFLVDSGTTVNGGSRVGISRHSMVPRLGLEQDEGRRYQEALESDTGRDNDPADSRSSQRDSGQA